MISNGYHAGGDPRGGRKGSRPAGPERGVTGIALARARQLLSASPGLQLFRE